MKRSPLRRATLDQVRAWQRRPRKPLRKRGAKARRENAALERFRREVRGRAAGFCEAWDLKYPSIVGVHVCEAGGRRHEGDAAHHIWPEDRDAGRHDARRGAYLCTAAHRWVHDHPAAAGLVGLLRPDPESRSADGR